MSSPKPASFIGRAGAFCLDMGVCYLAQFVMQFMHGLALGPDSPSMGIPMVAATGAGFYVLYAAATVKLFGATLGMKAAGIRVFRPDGWKIGWGSALVGALVSAATAGLGHLFSLFTPLKRSLHDLAAGTRVGYAEHVGSGRKWAMVPFGLGGILVVFPLVATLLWHTARDLAGKPHVPLAGSSDAQAARAELDAYKPVPYAPPAHLLLFLPGNLMPGNAGEDYMRVAPVMVLRLERDSQDGSLPPEAQALVEQALRKKDNAIAGALWTPASVTELYRGSLAFTALGLIADRYSKKAEAFEKKGMYKECREEAGKAVLLGYHLLQDWSDASQGTGLTAATGGLMRAGRCRRKAPELFRGGMLDIEAGKAVLDMGAYIGQAGELKRIMALASDPARIHELKVFLDEPALRRAYAFIVMTQVVLRWTPKEIAARLPDGARDKFLGYAVRHSDKRVGALGVGFMSILVDITGQVGTRPFQLVARPVFDSAGLLSRMLGDPAAAASPSGRAAQAADEDRRGQGSVANALAQVMRKAAAGDVEAQLDLGLYYQERLPSGGFRDSAKAQKWLQSAADAGSAKAALFLGKCYLFGCVGKPEPAMAGKIWLHLAKQGDADAMTALGELYEHGAKNPEDHRRAFNWYGKAAAQDHPAAYHNMGRLYLKGEGMPRDLRKARAAFERSLKLGYEPSRQVVEEMDRKNIGR